MRIIYCINSLEPSGGTERVLTTKMNYLSSLLNFEIFVITKKEIRRPFFALSHKVIHLQSRNNNKNDYKEFVKEQLYKLQPDITISVGGSEFSILPKLKDGSKKIYEFHYTKNYLINFVRGIHKIRLKQLHLLKVWWIQKKNECIAKKYDKVVVLTKRDMTLWKGFHNVCYIHDPLSFKSELKSTLIHKRIISIGSLTPAKGMDLLIQSFAFIAHQYKDWKLDIYGEGQDGEYLQELIENNNIKNQVRVHGYREDVISPLLNASIYAFPSRSDGFGLVITEAMECGLPVVAFDCPCGPSEIIEDEKTGLLVKEQDINAFANALERLIKDEKLRFEMGKNAIKSVHRFYTERTMPMWIDLFKGLITQPKK